MLEFTIRFIGWLLFIPAGLVLGIAFLCYIVPPLMVIFLMALGETHQNLAILLGIAYILSLFALVTMESMTDE